MTYIQTFQNQFNALVSDLLGIIFKGFSLFVNSLERSYSHNSFI